MPAHCKIGWAGYIGFLYTVLDTDLIKQNKLMATCEQSTLNTVYLSMPVWTLVLPQQLDSSVTAADSTFSATAIPGALPFIIYLYTLYCRHCIGLITDQQCKHQLQTSRLGSPCVYLMISIWNCSFKPQKKKKDRRKGKGGDQDEDDDEDVMLKLKKLSVQASDEEDEPGMMFQDCSSWYNDSYSHARTVVFQCPCLSAPQLLPPVKETRRIRFVISLQWHTVLHLHPPYSSHVGSIKHLWCSSGRKHICCSQPGPEWWWWGCWFGWRTSNKGKCWTSHGFKWAQCSCNLLKSTQNLHLSWLFTFLSPGRNMK